MDRKKLEELISEQNDGRFPMAKMSQESETELLINDHHYLIISDENHIFNFDEFTKKFNPALSKYDYIVGDLGYGQLRLQGFYDTSKVQAPGPFIDDLQTYIYENFNLGAKYFVIHNLEAKILPKRSRNFHNRHRDNNRNSKRHKNTDKAYIDQKITKQKAPVSKRKNRVVSDKQNGKHKFVIKEKNSK